MQVSSRSLEQAGKVFELWILLGASLSTMNDLKWADIQSHHGVLYLSVYLLYLFVKYLTLPERRTDPHFHVHRLVRSLAYGA